MSGKHRKRSRPAVAVAMVVAPAGLTAAAMAAGSIAGVAPSDRTVAAPAPSIDLLALVSAANSTSQFFAGSSYYGTDWSQVYGQQQDPQQIVVPFYKGPQGIADTIDGAQIGVNQTGVTASGWGAGQTGTALGILAEEQNTDALDSIGLVILDNNSNRAGGGFWTTYYPFAPLLGTTADPTPTDLPGVTILDVGYEYNINGDAAVDPMNPFALGNSLAAYAYGYGQESRALAITQEEPGGPVMFQPAGDVEPVVLEPGTHYVIKDGVIVGEYSADGTAENPNNSTIYVTVVSDELPLTRPLRLLPGGDILANAIDPVMTDLVNAGYNDGLGVEDNPTIGDHPAIPEDPTVLRPMKPFSSLSALEAGDLQDSAQEGLEDGVDTAQDDLSNPTNLITKPLAEAAKLPGISSLTSLTSSTAGITPFTSGSANKVVPNTQKSGTSSSATGSKPLQKIADDFSSSLKKFAAGQDKKKNESDDAS
ncbi:PE-PPE domain-containing protein [Mycolicibacterium stellerae]|uniref:PE-PPE domain-containing protein n=1 Tax=Mycolicibacterium stellerae TaxID=2358193 RepID=UPI000F0B4A51|nr:PE-PPE domain-containing protein [Mycolicibacterium stellerae]